MCLSDDIQLSAGNGHIPTWERHTMRRLRRLIRLVAPLIALLLLSACGKSAASGELAPAESERLVLYTSHKKEVWWPIVEEFEQRTGVWVEVVEGGTNELLERLENEKDVPRADVMFGGGVESLDACRDLFAPYTCAEADRILPSYRAADDAWTPFSALPVVLVYNPKLAPAGAVTSWADLLDPAWRGEIAFADPAVSGSCYTALVTLLSAVDLETDAALRAFSDALDDRQLAGSGEITAAVSEGASRIGVTLEETACKRIAAGDELALVYPADGTSCVPDGTAVIAGAPHEENARAFVDFTISRDVQELLQSALSRRSVRGDLDAPAGLPPLEEIAMVDYDVRWASENREALLMSWEFYFGAEEP